MNLALSPYHLTTREAPAMVAALLGDRVVTLLPTPFDGVGKEEVRSALRRCPRYGRLLESWRWAAALWREGVVVSTFRGEDAAGDMRAACRDIVEERRWEGFRRFLHGDLFLHEEEHLELFCADLLKGGPDPGISVPLTAGLDRFAARHGLLVVRAGARAAAERGGGGSLAQRAEDLLGRTLFSMAVPMVLAAGGQVVLQTREYLAEELARLRASIRGAVDGTEGQAGVREAARSYAAAFAASQGDLVGFDDEFGHRVTGGLVRVECRRMPAESALVSTVVALRSARAAGVRSGAFAGMGGAAGADRHAAGGGDAAAPAEITVLQVTPMAAGLA